MSYTVEVRWMGRMWRSCIRVATVEEAYLFAKAERKKWVKGARVSACYVGYKPAVTHRVVSSGKAIPVWEEVTDGRPTSSLGSD